MIKKYKLGNPIETNAVVEDIKITEMLTENRPLSSNRLTENVPLSSESLPAFSEKTFTLMMSPEACIYGLGETVRGINKRGWEYKSFCSDDPNHLEDKRSLYGAMNFFILDDADKCVGYFFDTPEVVTFDFGYTDYDQIKVKMSDGNAYIYVIEAENKREIVKEFRRIIGKSYVAPKWAFGLGQSRWSYRDEDEIRELVKRYKKAGIKLDMVYMDIDYMERYKDFTVDQNAFPDFKNFVEEMKNEGIHLIPIIDAGVKIEDGYGVYEEGVEKGYFCKKKDGSNFVAAVWPGKVHFPDFLNSKARDWFGNQYKFLLDMGIDGFWNDMNEPAIFYSEDHLRDVFAKIDEYKGKNLDIRSFFAFKDLVGTLDNNPIDYASFYHDMDGEIVRHDKVHNLYGYNMTRAAAEAFERICPEKDILLFSRASYIGMHRYGGIWTGDNKSWWSHLLLNIQQLPGLSMCGFLYSGADMGGFGADCTRDLMLRWLGVSMFTPLFRNHSADGTRRQEFDTFGDTEDFKNLIDIRYAFIPYLYDAYIKAIENDDMYIMPLSFVYENDDRAQNIEDQLLVGDSIMIAPVYTQNAKGRMVYLPERMRYLKFRTPTDFDEAILEKGDHYIEVLLNEIPVFVREGHTFIV